MEYADWLTDEDGKLGILLLDIKDGYNPPVNNSYVGGYFWSGNFFAVRDLSTSNEMDMIYIDAYPGRPGEEDSNRTLAHETQHLINFVTSYLKRVGADNYMVPMDLWIDEGLSSAAEYLCTEAHLEDRYQWFNQDPKGTIARGNNFFVWGNYTGDSILDDYATVYLFFQWLRIHGGAGIYKNIIGSPYSDHQAVTGAAHAAMGGNYGDWRTLLKTWLAANYLNDPSGPYGYKGDSTLKTVKAKTAPAGTTTLKLLPGEGVYSKTTAGGITGSYTSGSGASINYAGISAGTTTGTVSDTATSAGGALLTYNTSTNINGAGEDGKITGVADRIPSAGNLSRSAAGGTSGATVRIDARDMLARNGHPAGSAPARLSSPPAKTVTGAARGAGK
jgi:hypothetical protein